MNSFIRKPYLKKALFDLDRKNRPEGQLDIPAARTAARTGCRAPSPPRVTTEGRRHPEAAPRVPRHPESGVQRPRRGLGKNGLVAARVRDWLGAVGLGGRSDDGLCRAAPPRAHGRGQGPQGQVADQDHSKPCHGRAGVRGAGFGQGRWLGCPGCDQGPILTPWYGPIRAPGAMLQGFWG